METTGTVPDEAESMKAPRKVPLVIYLGGRRRIVGTAEVVDNEVTCRIDEDKGADLVRMISDGVIGSASVSFFATPDRPVSTELPRLEVQQFMNTNEGDTA